MESTNFNKSADQSSDKEAKGKWDAARDAVASKADLMRTQARDMANQTQEFVRINPWQAIGMAAMVGVTIGFLASRRS